MFGKIRSSHPIINILFLTPMVKVLRACSSRIVEARHNSTFLFRVEMFFILGFFEQGFGTRLENMLLFRIAISMQGSKNK